MYHLRGEEGECSLNQQTHQPLGVEDELIAASFLVSKCGDEQKNGTGFMMMAAFVHNRFVLLDTDVGVGFLAHT